MTDDKLLNPVSIRFPNGVKGRLEKVSRRFKLKESEIVRRALEEKLPEWEKSPQIVIKAQEEAA